MSCCAFDLVGLRNEKEDILYTSYCYSTRITFKSEILKGGFYQNYRNPSRSSLLSVCLSCMCLTVCLPCMCLSVCLSCMCLYVRLSCMCLYVRLSCMCLYVRLSCMCLSVCLSYISVCFTCLCLSCICLSVCLSCMCLSVCLSLCVSVCLCVCPICLVVDLSMCLSCMCLSVCLSCMCLSVFVLSVCVRACVESVYHHVILYHVIHAVSQVLMTRPCLASLNVNTRPTPTTSHHKGNSMILSSLSSIMLDKWSTILG